MTKLSNGIEKNLYIFSNNENAPVKALNTYEYIDLIEKEASGNFAASSHDTVVNGIPCYNKLDKLVEALSDEFEYLHIYNLSHTKLGKDLKVNKIHVTGMGECDEIGVYELAGTVKSNDYETATKIRDKVEF